MLVETCRLDTKRSSIGQSATGGTEIQLPALLELWEISVEGLAALACFDPMCSFLIWSPWYGTMFHQKGSRSTSEMKVLQLQCLMPRQPHTGLVDATDVDSQDLFEERQKALSQKSHLEMSWNNHLQEIPGSTLSEKTWTKNYCFQSWQESFGGHTDSKPRGPAGVGIDVTFEDCFRYFQLKI